MKPILIYSLHIFVIVMMVSFVLFSIFAATGSYDHWTTRFVKRLRFRKNRKDLPDDRPKPPII